MLKHSELEQKAEEESYEIFVNETILRFEVLRMHVKKYGPSLNEIERLNLTINNLTKADKIHIKHYTHVLTACDAIKELLNTHLGCKLYA